MGHTGVSVEADWTCCLILAEADCGLRGGLTHTLGLMAPRVYATLTHPCPQPGSEEPPGAVCWTRCCLRHAVYFFTWITCVSPTPIPKMQLSIFLFPLQPSLPYAPKINIFLQASFSRINNSINCPFIPARKL